MEDTNEPKLEEKLMSAAEERTPLNFIEDTAIDYANYTEFDSSKEREKFNENVEEMLTKLEEFCGLVDMIREDNNLCLKETLPRIQEKCSQMQEIFEKIDKLEAFVGVVRSDMAVLEECVNKAEDEMGSLSGLKKMLSSFVGQKKQVSKSDKKNVFVAPKTFNTEDFFPKPLESKLPEEGKSAINEKDQ
ncbi:biogenesis of lysosome-related organelles complex 1 subunit 4-like [Crassostrea virginica]